MSVGIINTPQPRSWRVPMVLGEYEFRDYILSYCKSVFGTCRDLLSMDYITFTTHLQII